MDRINGANTVDIGSGKRGWRKQNKTAGVSGTEWTEVFQNGLQEEVMNVIEGAGLTASATDWTQLKQAINRMIAADSRYTRVTTYATAGTYTWVAPVTAWYEVQVYGGGGGGGKYTSAPIGGEGGGGGGCAIKSVYLTAETSVTVTVGAAGTSSTTGSGTAGGTTSFGSHCSATGGGAGTAAGSHGTGGTGVGGDINLTGQHGVDGDPGYAAYVGAGGDAAGPLGGKGAHGTATSLATWPGGGGCITANDTGALATAPAAGGVVIRY